MADIIHEHTEDSGTNSLLVVIIIIVLAIGGFLLWKYLPANQTATPADTAGTTNVNVTLPAVPATTN